MAEIKKEILITFSSNTGNALATQWRCKDNIRNSGLPIPFKNEGEKISYRL
ncbi:hypothetical protein [Chryseobacterium lacus]|uniref:hypothetical protein n=1 Tax=Chryseobacterium lacus TaxID=2058346 RepID=UPI00140C79C1|nr:hypothetical protein [Chryseobacterium lacus]